MQSIFPFLKIKVVDFWQENAENSRNLSGNFYICWIFFRYGVTLPSFITVGYV